MSGPTSCINFSPPAPGGELATQRLTIAEGRPLEISSLSPGVVDFQELADGVASAMRDARPRAAAATNPRPDPGPPPEAHAVIIGIDTYQDHRIRRLDYACADARAMYRVLTAPDTGRFQPDRVTLLLNDEASERAIRTALATNLPKRASKQDTVCVYFAGHGAPVINPKTNAADGLEKYILPYDADPDNLRATAISMDAVPGFFDLIDANQILFFLDCCYSGIAGGRTIEHPDFGMRSAQSSEFLEQIAGQGRVVVTACSASEVSLEPHALGHGLFTYYLVKGLAGEADVDGDGVTIDELYSYVYNNVQRESRKLGGSMSPVRRGTVQGAVYLTRFVAEVGGVRVKPATVGVSGGPAPGPMAVQAGHVKTTAAGAPRRRPSAVAGAWREKRGVLWTALGLAAVGSALAFYIAARDEDWRPGIIGPLLLLLLAMSWLTGAGSGPGARRRILVTFSAALLILFDAVLGASAFLDRPRPLLADPPSLRVEGRVVDDSGTPVAAAAVRIVGFAADTTDADGVFLIRLGGSEYRVGNQVRIRVTHQAYAAPAVIDTQLVDTRTEVTITMDGPSR
ncbi:MAG: caspase family protein [Gemmatimonadetes bacterium]|nr:caspase family protein [Gemmatimonadota bacterium]